MSPEDVRILRAQSCVPFVIICYSLVVFPSGKALNQFVMGLPYIFISATLLPTPSMAAVEKKRM